MLLVVQHPLQRLEVTLVHLDVVGAEGLHGELLRHANAPILQGGKHGGGHQVVVHLQRATVVDALHQAHACLDGHGGQLLASVQHVTDGVDVRHVGHLVDAGNLAVLGVALHAGGGQVQALGDGEAPHGKNHGVKLSIKLRSEHSVFHRDLDFSLGCFFKLAGLRVAHEVGAVAFHEAHDLIRDLGVKATQRHRADGDGCVVPQRGEEACGLERDVRSAHAQRLARGRREGEDVVRGDATFPSAGDVQVAGAATHGDDELVSGDGLHLAALLGGGDGVRIHEGSVRVHVLHVFVAQGGAVPEVERPNVVLNGGHHLVPVVTLGLDVPAELLGVGEGLAQDARLVHQLLRDAPHVDAGAAQSPGGARRGGFDEVEANYLGPELGRFLGSREAAGATAEHDEVVLVRVVAHGGRGHGGGGRRCR
mmetsp:Transcript_16990/g.41939  ORF Transcript_16990/g.41939 Transcript_16990/m.41939 type:complete len:422 (-) Transcript_16990:210-1475(-)